MNQDRKAALIHDGIQAFGILIAALPQNFVTSPWGHFLSAIPGALTVAFGQYLSWQYNAAAPTQPSVAPTPSPKP